MPNYKQSGRLKARNWQGDGWRRQRILPFPLPPHNAQLSKLRLYQRRSSFHPGNPVCDPPERRLLSMCSPEKSPYHYFTAILNENIFKILGHS